MSVESKIVRDEERGTATLTVIIPGKATLQATSGHPNWDELVAEAFKLEPDTDRLIELEDIEETAIRNFSRLSERVTVEYGKVLFDSVPQDHSLARQIVRFVRAGEPFEPLVKFYEKIETNPNVHSREQLFDWLQSHDFSIDEEGDLRGYKGVERVGEGTYKSIHSGRAIVDDEPQQGRIEQKIGSVVSMPRDQVNESPRVACSAGLHISTHSYAQSWGRGVEGRVIEVKINPRDICAVPEAEKVRSCRYTVIGEKDDKPHEDPLIRVEPQPEPEPVAPEPTPTLDLTGQGTPVVKPTSKPPKPPIKEGAITDELRKKYSGKRFWQNRKTGKYFIETSKKLGVVRLLAADGSGERRTQTEKSIKKSFRLRDG